MCLSEVERKTLFPSLTLYQLVKNLFITTFRLDSVPPSRDNNALQLQIRNPEAFIIVLGSGAARRRSQGEVRKLWGGWGARLWIDACWETRRFVTSAVVLAAAGRLRCTLTCTRQAYWNDVTHQPKALHHPDVFIFICFRLIYRWTLAIYYIKNGPGLWAIWLFIREDTSPSFLPSSPLSLFTGWTVKWYFGLPHIGWTGCTGIPRIPKQRWFICRPSAVGVFTIQTLLKCSSEWIQARVVLMEPGRDCTSFSAKLQGCGFNSVHKN